MTRDVARDVRRDETRDVARCVTKEVTITSSEVRQGRCGPGPTRRRRETRVALRARPGPTRGCPARQGGGPARLLGGKLRTAQPQRGDPLPLAAGRGPLPGLGVAPRRSRRPPPLALATASAGGRLAARQGPTQWSRLVRRRRRDSEGRRLGGEAHGMARLRPSLKRPFRPAPPPADPRRMLTPPRCGHATAAYGRATFPRLPRSRSRHSPRRLGGLAQWSARDMLDGGLVE